MPDLRVFEEISMISLRESKEHLLFLYYLALKWRRLMQYKKNQKCYACIL